MVDLTLQLNLKESTILEYCINGFQNVLGEIGAARGKDSIPVVMTSGPYARRALAQQKKEDTYPFIGISLRGVSDTDELMYNKQVLYNGISFGPTTRLKLVPTALEFEISYFTDTLLDVTSFIQRWRFREREMQFNMITDTANIGIKVKANSAMTVPDMQVEDIGNTFVLETSAIVYGYSGELEKITPIKTIAVTTQPVNNENVPIVGSNTFTIKLNKSIPNSKIG